MRLVGVLSLLLAGCLGPVLVLPKYPHVAHEWLCARLVCPAAATRIGGIVVGVKYDRTTRRCECALEDSRNMPVTEFIDPHSR